MGRACVLVLALVVGLACGSASTASYEQSHSAKQVVTDASKSTGSATSFHLAADVTTQQGPAHAEFDVEGLNVSGKVSYQSTNVRIMHVDGKTFVYGADLADSLASTNAQAAATVKAKAADKWVLMPEEFWTSTGITELTDIKKTTDCLQSASGLTKKGTSTVSGKRVVEVDDELTSQMYVDTASPHYFVRVALAGKDTCVTGPAVTQETIDLTKVGAKLNIAVPAGYVDVQSLQNG